MCSIIRCFGWGLDVVQRMLTLMLACFMCFAIVIGMLMAIMAGIAYGYNYSLAEYIDTSKADLTVYVRRGSFGDKPAFRPLGRRSGEEPDMFSSNYSVDYEGPSVGDETKPLSAAWQKAQDTRSYAEKLTKYARIKTNLRRFPNDDEEMPATNIFQPKDDNAFTQEPSAPVFNHQSPDVPAEQILNATYDPNDPPLYMYTSTDSGIEMDKEKSDRRHNFRKHKHKKLRKPDIKIDVGEDKSLYVQPYNKTAVSYLKRDYEDVDYLNMYKPV